MCVSVSSSDSIYNLSPSYSIYIENVMLSGAALLLILRKKKYSEIKKKTKSSTMSLDVMQFSSLVSLNGTKYISCCSAYYQITCIFMYCYIVFDARYLDNSYCDVL